VLTIFSIPKPFAGSTALIQRNAVASWRALAPDVQVVLVGDDQGVGAAARELGVDHLADVERSEEGTPRLDDAFARVDAHALHPLRCFVNADIVLLDDFLPAVLRARRASFLMIGETRDLLVHEALALGDAAVRASLRRRALEDGRSRGPTAIDYFVFSEGLFGRLPPFVVGRARFDNWLVWRARQAGPVIDATAAVVAIHQAHEYGHLAGGLDEAHYGPEAARNDELAGGSRRAYTIHDASHVLRADGRVTRNLGSVLRVRERARKVAWKVGRR
jgi:hypothetical protein